MNLAVDRPTKVIRLNIADNRIGRGKGVLTEWNDFGGEKNQSWNRLEENTFSKSICVGHGECGFLVESGRVDLCNEKMRDKIDFYELIPDSCSGEIEEEIHRNGAGQRTDYAVDCEKSMMSLEIDFIILSLQYDIRVRSFNIHESSVDIAFWTIDDSISFYKQYFSVKAMRFCASGNWDDLPFSESAGICCGEIISLDSLDSRKRQKVCDKKRSLIGGVLEPSIKKDEQVGREVVFGKMSHALSKLQEKCQGGSRRISTDDPFCSPSYISSEQESREIEGTGEEYKQENAGSISSIPDTALGEECHNSEISWSREQLFQRIDYFNKMKNFFSKSDVKKMQTLCEEGRLSFLYQNSKEISCGCFSNVVMQNAVKSIGEEGLCEIIRNLGSDVVPISATKYGAYTVQTIILCAAGAESQGLLSQYFSLNGHFLIDHEIGNYSIQKILRFNDALVFDLCMISLPLILRSGLGLKVFKRCIEFFKDRYDDVRAMIKRCEESENEKACQMLLQLLENNQN